MINPGISFGSAAAHGIAHDIVMVGPAALISAVYIPVIIGMSAFQTQIPAAILRKLWKIQTASVRYIAGQIVRLVFAVQFTVKLQARETIFHIHPGLVVPFIIRVRILAPHPVPGVAELKRVAVAAQQRQARQPDTQIFINMFVADAHQIGMIEIVDAVIRPLAVQLTDESRQAGRA